MEALLAGFGLHDAALAAVRMGVGTFFAITGWYKITNPVWHKGLEETLRSLHIPFVRFNVWWVPCVECFAGLACVVGLLSPLAAAGLLTIMIVAMCTDGPRKVRELGPNGKVEVLDDWLYIPETLYAIMLLVVIFAGPGRYSLDHYLLMYLRGVL